MMAKKNTGNDANSGFIITDEEIKRREKIPKRATKINIGLMIFALVCVVIIRRTFIMDEERRVFLVVVMLSLAKALCNPMVTRFAFQVNRQIQQESVEDRRQNEIEDALKRRAEQQKAKGKQNENQAQPGSSIQTVDEASKAKVPKRFCQNKTETEEKEGLPKVDI